MTYDDHAAKREGWSVFECDSGTLRIQRVDCPCDWFDGMPDEPLFDSDDAAIEFVVKHAENGSANHQAALLLCLLPECASDNDMEILGAANNEA